MTAVTSTAGLPIDSEICFSDHKGVYQKKLEKRQTGWLAKLAPALRSLLEPDERILLAAPGCSPMSVGEQLTTGWIIYYLKRCVLVVTDRRILHVLTNPSYAPRGSAADVRHGDVVEARVRTFLGRSLRLRYRSGKSEEFQQLDPSVSRKLKALLPSLVGKGTPSEEGARTHLCPRCAKRLAADTYRCSSCFLEFKTKAAALRYSILFPGGGYFYTGHPVLGVLDALAEAFLIVMLIVSLVDLLTGTSADADPGAVVVFGALLVVEKLLSVFHARHYVKEYLPAERDVRPLRATS